MRPSQAFFAASSVSLVLASSCADPVGDYNAYLDATAAYRPMDVAVTTDTVAPTMSIKATYYLSCLPSLSFGDINKLFRFYVDSEFTPSMSGGGTLTLALTPMRIRDDMGNLLPADMLKLHKEATGLLSVMNTPVDSKGKFNANFMTAMVAATSNPISFRDITVMNTTVVGIFQAAPDGGAGDYCGGLTGQVTAPIMQDLGPASNNPCLFKPLAAESPLPTAVITDYMCSGI